MELGDAAGESLPEAASRHGAARRGSRDRTTGRDPQDALQRRTGGRRARAAAAFDCEQDLDCDQEVHCDQELDGNQSSQIRPA